MNIHQDFPALCAFARTPYLWSQVDLLIPKLHNDDAISVALSLAGYRGNTEADVKADAIQRLIHGYH